jgi:hypothetical protein
VRKFWSRLFGKKAPPSAVNAQGFILHDPASQRPHDLDDPYFDSELQARTGKVIGSAIRKSRRGDSKTKKT